jgi:rhodanese-related sulfurtransferase
MWPGRLAMWRPSYAGAMSYAGDVAPEEAYAALASEPEAVLVDVRTSAEWSYVGLPDLSALGKRVVCVQWQRWPDGAVNGDFVEQLRDAGLPEGAPLYFLCRSGVRSVAAAHAATAAGLEPSYNILDGFEGPHDEQGHRAVAGWKNSGLPWRQG